MRLRALLAVSLISTATSQVAFGAPPSAEHIKSAAAEYDAGRRAFTDGKFEDAAIHFENAYHDAPAAQALRFAIRARKQANQLARAATLAIIAQQNYADDEPTQQAVKEVLAEATPKLFKMSVSCDVECAVAADGRVVSLEDAKRFSFFLQPGPHNISVSWPGDRTKSLDVKAREGQALEQSFVAPPMPVANNNNAIGGGGGTTLTEQPANKPFGPAVFITLLSLTAVSGGILIWSGIDTLNNPGPDYVKANCVGQGEQCPAYQQGVASQTRTNVLIGVTGGLGLLTFVSVFLTQWSHPHKEAGPKVEAMIGLGTVGLAGRF